MSAHEHQTLLTKPFILHKVPQHDLLTVNSCWGRVSNLAVLTGFKSNPTWAYEHYLQFIFGTIQAGFKLALHVQPLQQMSRPASVVWCTGQLCENTETQNIFVWAAASAVRLRRVLVMRHNHRSHVDKEDRNRKPTVTVSGWQDNVESVSFRERTGQLRRQPCFIRHIRSWPGREEC